MAIGAKYNGLVEYVAEVTPGTFPATPAMAWLGRVMNFTPNAETKIDTIRYLPGFATTDNKALSLRNIKTGESLGFEIEYVPQVGGLVTFLDYVLGKNGSAIPSDTQPSFSLGVVNNATATNKYTKWSGCYGQEFSLEAPEDGKITCKVKAIAWEKLIGSVDYKSSGSHATESTAAELTLDDISAVQMGYTGGALASITDNVNALGFTVSNSLGISKDINSTLSTRIKNTVVTGRDIKLSLDLDYIDIATASANNLSISDIRGGTAFDVAFTLDGKTYKFIGVKFPSLPYSFGADDLIGDKVTSVSCTGMTVT